MDGSVVNILADIKTKSNNIFHFQDKFEYMEIYWDSAACKNISVHDKMLIIVDKSYSECQNIQASNNPLVNILFLELDTQYRSSSGYNTDTEQLIINMKYDLQRMENDVKKYNYLYLSRDEPNPSIIRQYLSCSQSSIVQIRFDENIRDNGCITVKTLNMSGQLIEIQCVYINNIMYSVYVPCNTISSSPKFMYNKEELTAVKFVDKNGGMFNSCCINSTHHVNYFGHCEFKIINPLITKDLSSTSIMSEDCSLALHLKNIVSVLMYSSCLIKITSLTSCDHSYNFFSTCSSIFCNL